MKQEKTTAVLRKMFPLTDAEKKIIFCKAQGIWDNIGYDVLQAIAEDKRKDINTINVSRATVIELVLDGDRLKESLRKETSEGIRRLFPENWDRDSSDYQGVLLKECFQYGRYGM
jgi:hypothetical protein